MKKKYRHIEDVEKLKGTLEQIIKQLHTMEDPHALTEYRNFFKKNTNFFSRSLVSAFILKQFVEGKGRSSLPQKNSRVRSNNQQQRSLRDSPKPSSKPGQRRISLNMGASQCTKDEILEFLAECKNLSSQDYSFFKQTPRHSVLMINSDKIKDLINYVKENKFKDKKLYADLRDRY